MNLTVDIGNSAVKAALFDEKGRLVRVVESGKLKVESYDRAIVVSTRGDMPELELVLRERVGQVLKFDHTTPVPVKNLYGTPETLGYDRLAAAVGAHALFPEHNVLVVDFGTAITYDVVTAAGEFLGGNISPGAGMRFRSLNEQTVNLPLVSLPVRELSSFGKEEYPEPEDSGDVAGKFPARNTRKAIESGVVTGIIAETEHYIGAVGKKYDEIKIIFTGGDADYFAGRVNFPIFATSELIFYGLNAILEYNAN